MKHEWDYQCHCSSCTGFELNLKLSMQLDEKKRKEAPKFVSLQVYSHEILDKVRDYRLAEGKDIY